MIRHNPFTLLIHIALVIILAGALCTHFFGIQGEITIKDCKSSQIFSNTSGTGSDRLPFGVSLINADVEFYPGTTTPMDFKSTICVNNNDYKVSMNKPALIDGWRFYQSGMDTDSSTFTLSYDPWGIFITYVGYIMLAIGLIGFFFQKNTAWRSLIKRGSLLGILLCLCSGMANASELPTMQKPLAANLGKVYVYWNDRICPMQTMARDVTVKLYGSESYEGMTSEQVLTGWLFYFDEWLTDYSSNNPEIKSHDIDKKNKKLLERKYLISILGTGEAFKIYPYQTTEGFTEWLSLTGRRPSGMSLEQWKFMQTTMPHIKELLLHGKNINANDEINRLVANQKKYAGEDDLPSATKIKAEILYNRFVRPVYGGIIALLLSSAFLFFGLSKRKSGVKPLLTFVHAALTITVVNAVMLSWWLGGHVPLSNGSEMMIFMAAISLIFAFSLKDDIVKGALLMVAGMALMVAGMASRSPQIGSLMPVLSSPLLSAHVMVIMCAYVLFLMMAVLSLIALISKNNKCKEDLSRINRIILTPAVTLLAMGIMIGAVWANQSWGRYWGWDPKETCALVMLLVYAIPLHWACPKCRCFRKPDFLHRYLLIALVTVLFTYFGANFLIPGLHSYA
ncbi:MAG: cytochrome c biogenesis protein CcsA [Muribaculum sp.]|nr:cytochrome c biogenesis protein CcsA [Muribaculum sp.]